MKTYKSLPTLSDDLSLRELVIRMCGMMSVSGFEEKSREALFSLLAPYFDECHTDPVGNHVLMKYCEKENAPTVLIDAHFDEIGLMVTKVLDGGFLRVAPIGGIDPSILQASDVIVYGKEAYRGVVVSIPPHLRGGRSGEELPAVEEMMIDTGLSGSADELRALIPEGTPVGFAPCYGRLGGEESENELLVGKSFDNKACGAAAAYAIGSTPRGELAANVCLLLSSYEETSRLGGVSAGTYRIAPDYAMVADVNLAKVPGTKDVETVPFEKGISISYSAATDRALTRFTKALCEAKEIPYCMCTAPTSTGTNAATLNLVGEGIPVVDVGLPLKNMHTYNEVISLKDVRALCDLTRAVICSQEMAERFGSAGKEWS